MVQRRHRRRSLLLLAIPVAALAFIVSVRVFGPENPCQRPSAAAPQAETALMPAGLTFDRIGTITRVRMDDGHVTMQAFTTKPIDEAALLIQDAVVAAGYRPAGIESEGVEAHVFFTTESSAAGQARLQRTDCDDGRSDIELVLLDRGAAS
jgi:hypothetical protein